MSNPYAPPQATVHDVVDARDTAAAADRGTRLGASILDGVIAGGIVMIGFLLAALVARTSGAGPNPATLVIPALLALSGIGVWCWLTYKYVKANGQSIGKKVLGIKVVRRDGSAASVARIFWLRNVVNGVLGVIPLYGLIDCVFIFADSRQCIHDKLADTIVVKA
jgi:uncharacterized RDD family membrane protein YckC